MRDRTPMTDRPLHILRTVTTVIDKKAPEAHGDEDLNMEDREVKKVG